MEENVIGMVTGLPILYNRMLYISSCILWWRYRLQKKMNTPFLTLPYGGIKRHQDSLRSQCLVCQSWATIGLPAHIRKTWQTILTFVVGQQPLMVIVSIIEAKEEVRLSSIKKDAYAGACGRQFS